MAKELPFFRFTASEWLTDDISFESYEVKGLFIDVCAFYWFKDCSVTKELLFKKFSNATVLLEQLLKTPIIKQNNSEFIEILFLDSQYDLLSRKRKKRQKAGKLGGLAKSSNAVAKRKQNPSYKDKDNDKYSEDSIPFRISVYLYEKILERNSNQKKPNLQQWSKHIDKMVSLDKRDPKIIGGVIDWVQKDDFWADNILSTGKLREKFDQLLLKSGKSRGEKKERPRTKNELEMDSRRF